MSYVPKYVEFFKTKCEKFHPPRGIFFDILLYYFIYVIIKTYINSFIFVYIIYFTDS